MLTDKSMLAGIELLCFNLSPERWQEVYMGQPHSQISRPLEEEEEEIPITDIEELDAYYRNLERQRVMHGGSVPDPNYGVPEPQWGEWQ